MKNFIVTLIQLALLILLLAGCSTGNQLKSIEPTYSPKNVNISGGIAFTEEGKDGPSTPVEDTTPSPAAASFEQNYGPNEISERDLSELEIVTLLPPDAIPALTNPDYYSVKEANQEYFPDELVIGVEFNGDARAYAVSLLSSHEIVNDTVGGIRLAVTW
jgi:hypothetical protein